MVSFVNQKRQITDFEKIVIDLMMYDCLDDTWLHAIIFVVIVSVS